MHIRKQLKIFTRAGLKKITKDTDHVMFDDPYLMPDLFLNQHTIPHISLVAGLSRFERDSLGSYAFFHNHCLLWQNQGKSKCVWYYPSTEESVLNDYEFLEKILSTIKNKNPAPGLKKFLKSISFIPWKQVNQTPRVEIRSKYGEKNNWDIGVHWMRVLKDFIHRECNLARIPQTNSTDAVLVIQPECKTPTPSSIMEPNYPFASTISALVDFYLIHPEYIDPVYFELPIVYSYGFTPTLFGAGHNDSKELEELGSNRFNMQDVTKQSRYRCFDSRWIATR